ncbi:hypothetical protein Tco_1560662, partial [Tanacetum coccineum]
MFVTATNPTLPSSSSPPRHCHGHTHATIIISTATPCHAPPPARNHTAAIITAPRR